MNNRWNKIIYKCWSPLYDRIFNTGQFLKARQKMFKEIEFKKGSKILFVGVGTGADLSFFLNKGYEITGIDISRDMLEIAKAKYDDKDISLIEMDAQNMKFESESFDYIFGDLILSVVPDPTLTMKEMVRVLKRGGNVYILDKFIPKNKEIRTGQKLLRPMIKWLGTDIGLDFYQIQHYVKEESKVLIDEEIMMHGLYRKIVCEKTAKSNQLD
ncbi:class I SAM-dependent methyltransferase [Mesobacillus zeae]|uniref:Methyltransferase domain-containing protein n=1 Tax=Mesobacillus zeae TaxID=1917180 RepID=A0A398B361_9BACI|nr:methyltransferase domain-containing protein [Mesobacillus zeae]RID82226.1 methyltransferase domain-containing protein [Mesobacillus zeae]